MPVTTVRISNPQQQSVMMVVVRAIKPRKAVVLLQRALHSRCL